MKRSDISDEEIFDAIRKRQKDDPPFPTPDVQLSRKYPVKLILAKMSHMVERGLLDYGVSLRTAWIIGEESNTAAGEAL